MAHSSKSPKKESVPVIMDTKKSVPVMPSGKSTPSSPLPTPPSTPPRKSNLWLILIIVIVLAIIAAIAINMKPKEVSPPNGQTPVNGSQLETPASIEITGSEIPPDDPPIIEPGKEPDGSEQTSDGATQVPPTPPVERREVRGALTERHQGTVLVALRAVFEGEGWEVDWIDSEQHAVCTDGVITITVYPEQRSADIDNRTVTLSVAPELVIINDQGGGRILVPLEFLNANLDNHVEYDQVTEKVYLVE